MYDFLDNMESAAENAYFDMLQPDGKLKCFCGNIFDPNKEGVSLSANPYCMPVCNQCLISYCDGN